MKLITDIIVFHEDFDESYMVQGEIDITPGSYFGVRQACPLDMPETIILPGGYEGETKFTPDDFSAIILSSGHEYIIRIAYPDLMIMLKFEEK